MLTIVTLGVYVFMHAVTYTEGFDTVALRWAYSVTNDKNNENVWDNDNVTWPGL
jgi:hypothetical protein